MPPTIIGPKERAFADFGGLGVYLWEDRAAASAFEPRLRAMIEAALGVVPTITGFETPVVVDNLAEAVTTA